MTLKIVQTPKGTFRGLEAAGAAYGVSPAAAGKWAAAGKNGFVVLQKVPHSNNGQACIDHEGREFPSILALAHHHGIPRDKAVFRLARNWNGWRWKG